MKEVTYKSDLLPTLKGLQEVYERDEPELLAMRQRGYNPKILTKGGQPLGHLRTIVNTLSETFDGIDVPYGIYLIGSQENGFWKANSDIDLAVHCGYDSAILRRSKPRIKRKINSAGLTYVPTAYPNIFSVYNGQIPESDLAESKVFGHYPRENFVDVSFTRAKPEGKLLSGSISR